MRVGKCHPLTFTFSEEATAPSQETFDCHLALSRVGQALAEAPGERALLLQEVPCAFRWWVSRGLSHADLALGPSGVPCLVPAALALGLGSLE